MGDRGHVGVINPDGTVSIRYVHSDANLQYLPFAIARIWWATFDRDTTKTIAALLEHDWADLDPTTQTDSKTWAWRHPGPRCRHAHRAADRRPDNRPAGAAADAAWTAVSVRSGKAGISGHYPYTRPQAHGRNGFRAFGGRNSGNRAAIAGHARLLPRLNNSSND